MALKAELEALLKTMSPEEAEAQRKIFEKYPVLADGYLRQADYDRSMNENKDKLAKAEEWKKWADKNVPIHDDLRTRYDRLEAEAAELRTKVAEKVAESVEAHGGEPADVAKVTAAVLAKLGGEPVSKTELAKLVGDETTKLVTKAVEEARKNFYEKDFAAATGWITGMNAVQWDYRDEFGKNLNRVEFAKFMKDNQIDDPLKAYEQYVAPQRKEKEIAAETEKRVAAKVEEMKQKGEFPGSSGSPQPVGGLQIRLNKKDADDPLFGKTVELGDGSVAAAAANELRNEGRI